MGQGKPPERLKSGGAPELAIGQSLAIGDSNKVAPETERGDGAPFDWSAFADQLDVCDCPDGRLLADHLETSLAIEALDMAVATRGPERLSLIHRTVRSVQYAPSIAYRARREDRKAPVSMSREANPRRSAP
jgi:hypothetical protein